MPGTIDRPSQASAFHRFFLFFLVLFLALLRLSASPAEAEFDAHGGPVKSVAISTDGSLALTASFDTSIILWNLEDRTVRAEFHGHDAAVNAIVFLPDDRRALSASDDGTLRLWPLDGTESEALLEGHRGKVVAVAVSPDGALAASAGWDRTVRLWDLDKGASLHSLDWRDNVNAVRFSGDGGTLIAGTSDGALVAWSTADGTRLSVIDAHDFAITGVARHDDEGITATASIDETVRLWKLDPTSEETAAAQTSDAASTTLFGHAGPVLSVAISVDGDLVASGGVDGTVRVWRRGDGDRLRVFARHRGPVWSVAFTPDGKTLLSGGADGLVLTYDLDASAMADDDIATADVDAALLAAVDKQTETTADNGADGAFKRGEKLFRTCAACHTLTPDDGHRAGPTLHGLFGRTAGSHPDYRYSEALKKSDLVWSEDTIHRLFDIGPDHLLPGTKMPLQRMPDRQDRAALIAYLKQVTRP